MPTIAYARNVVHIPRTESVSSSPICSVVCPIGNATCQAHFWVALWASAVPGTKAPREVRTASRHGWV